jgi:hypothetical protein
MCDWTPMCRCMCVEVFFEVVTLDISPPLAVALDGGTVVFPTTTMIDFFPEVRHCVAHHWYTALCWWACIRQRWRCMLNEWRAHRRWGAGPLHRWLTPPLMVWHIDGSDNELVDVMVHTLVGGGLLSSWCGASNASSMPAAVGGGVVIHVVR